MTKTTYGTFVVSFNTDEFGYELGDAERNTIDYSGDMIGALVQEVLNDSSPDYPLTFKSKARIGNRPLGEFVNEDGDVVAILYRL